MTSAIEEAPIIKRFRKTEIAHARQEAVLRTLTAQLRGARDGFNLLVGPPGVGKSLVAKLVCEWAKAQCDESCRNDPNHVPFVLIQVKGVPGRLAPIVAVVRRWLEESGDELIAYARVTPTNDATFQRFVKKVRRGNPHVVIFDDAHDLLPLKGSQYRSYAQPLKWLPKDLRAPVLLIGTHDLLRFQRQSGELIRRSRRTEYDRYLRDPEGKRCFKGVLKAFDAKLRELKAIESDFKLESSEALLYEGCVGCVGTLRDWIDAGLLLAVAAGRQLCLADLEAAQLSSDAVEALLDIIEPEEQRLRADAERRSNIAERLGLTKAELEASAKARGKGKKNKSKTRTKPGRPKPATYDVGAADEFSEAAAG